MKKQLTILLTILHATMHGYAPSFPRLAQKFARMKPAGYYYKGSQGFNKSHAELTKHQPKFSKTQQIFSSNKETSVSTLAQVSSQVITKSNAPAPKTYTTKAEALQAQKNRLIHQATKAYFNKQEQTVQSYQLLRPKSMIPYGYDQLILQAAQNKHQAYTGNISTSKIIGTLATGTGLTTYSHNKEEVDTKALNWYNRLKAHYASHMALCKKESDIEYLQSLSDIEKTKALNQAIMNNDKELMNLLLKAGANPTPALALAVQRNNVTATEIFLEVGANLPNLSPVVTPPLRWMQYLLSFIVTQPQTEPNRSTTEKIIESYSNDTSKAILKTRAQAFKKRLEEKAEEKKDARDREDFYNQSLQLADASVSLNTLVQGTKELAPVVAQASFDKAYKVLNTTKQSFTQAMKSTTKMEPNFGLWS